jgi:hypothetical protein
MYYYHLRYNLYGGAGFAVEEERWLEFTEQLDDTQVKHHLEAEHQQPVTIILSKNISYEEYELSLRNVF